MRVLGIVLCLIALGLTGYSALVYKAPKMQADIEARTHSAATAGEAAKAAEGDADQPRIALQGQQADDQVSEKLLGKADQPSGGPIDTSEPPAAISPYSFDASKDEDGAVTIKGVAPSAELQALMIADARAIFGDDVGVEITLAAGAPAGDWRSIAGSGMDALATLQRGRLSIAGRDVLLEGDVDNDRDAEAVAIFAETAPEDFSWTNHVVVRRAPVKPFTFTVEKSSGGGLSLKGYSPDEVTRDAMIEQAKTAAAGMAVVADIQIAEGMPDAEWPALVQAGIAAMAEMEVGRFDVSDNDVSFSSDVATDAELAALKAISANTVSDSDPTAGLEAGQEDRRLTPDGPAAVRPYVMTVDKIEEGVWSVRGAVPDAEGREAFLAAVKKQAKVEQVEAELTLAAGMPGEDWQQFVIERLEVLDVVAAGRLSFEDYQVHLLGVVDTHDDIDPVRAKLAAIDSDMTTDLQPIDPRPSVSLDLVMSPDDGVVLAGALPEGLSEKEAALALGLQDYKGGFDENGRGDVEAWRHDLLEIGNYLPQFEQVGVVLGTDQANIEGRLHAYGDADQVTRGLLEVLGQGRKPIINVKATDAVYAAGTRRVNPLTGREEEFDRGYWLPVIEITGGLEECRGRSSRILAANKITFLRGEAVLDARAENTVSNLAALVRKCLENGVFALEIGGHTDSRGAKSMNQELSQARADAVLRALKLRGVKEIALIAVGHGDAQPIADNATDEGKAQNRRITFEWLTPNNVTTSGADG